MSPSLRQRILRASGWSLGSHVVAQGIRLGGNLILTRLLVPEMFGVMAIVYVLMIGLTLFSDIGIRQSIVQSTRGEDGVFLDTAWSVQIVRGVFIWLVALLLSLGLLFAQHAMWVEAGTVYANPILPLVVAIFTLTAILQGFESTKLAMARRMLQLDQVAKIEVLAQVLGLIVMVIWARLSPTIWSLVAGAFAAGLARALGSHVLLRGHANRWLWDKTALQEILSFGKWIFLSSMLGFLVINGDRLLLGGMIDAHLLGLYAIAFLLVNSLQVALSQLIGNVAFPALSEVVRSAPERLKATYYKFRVPLDAALLGASGLLFGLGPWIVNLLYDTRYSGAGPILQILALGGFAARYQISEQLFLSLGQPRLLTICTALRLVTLYTMLPLGYLFWGLDGALWAIVLAPASVLPVVLYFKHQNGLLDLKKEFLLLPFFLLGWVLAAGWLRLLGAA